MSTPTIPEQHSKPPQRRAVIYTRVAAPDAPQDRIEDQVRQCQAMCDANGYEVVAIHCDSGASGTNRNRRGYRQTVELIVTGQADIVVATDLDRLTRSVRDALDLTDLCQHHGVRIHLVTHPTAQLQRGSTHALSRYARGRR